ncbi:MAG TPA: hypothetical protein VGL12_02915 [Roseiarcus sp.]
MTDLLADVGGVYTRACARDDLPNKRELAIGSPWPRRLQQWGL